MAVFLFIYSNFYFQIGCSKVIYLFDVLTLGAPCFDEGLQDILESGDILKVLALKTSRLSFGNHSYISAL